MTMLTIPSQGMLGYLNGIMNARAPRRNRDGHSSSIPRSVPFQRPPALYRPCNRDVTTSSRNPSGISTQFLTSEVIASFTGECKGI
jgi:hypothetical protein